MTALTPPRGRHARPRSLRRRGLIYWLLYADVALFMACAIVGAIHK